jgi:methionyl-tRNA formyltransferase
LLPKYRGAAPINWTLMQGENITGYTIIQMDEHVDTGPILASAPCAIEPTDDAISLGERLAEAGAEGVVAVLTRLESGALVAYPQADVGVSYAPKLTRELGKLGWHRAASTLHNLVRALVPWPGAWMLWQETEVKVWRTTVSAVPTSALPGTVTAVKAIGMTIACGAQQLVVHEVQPASRRRMTANEFAQGYRVQPGDCFA